MAAECLSFLFLCLSVSHSIPPTHPRVSCEPLLGGEQAERGCVTLFFLSSFCWGHTADREDLRVACFFLVRLDSIEIFFLVSFSHLTSPYLASWFIFSRPLSPSP